MLLHRHLDIDGVEEITVPGNRNGRALTKPDRPRERALNCLKRERRVPVRMVRVMDGVSDCRHRWRYERRV